MKENHGRAVMGTAFSRRRASREDRQVTLPGTLPAIGFYFGGVVIAIRTGGNVVMSRVNRFPSVTSGEPQRISYRRLAARLAS